MEQYKKRRIRLVPDPSCAYTQNQDVAVEIWSMETRSQQERWEGSGLINTEKNLLYGGELYGIYIVLRFIVKMWDESNNKNGK